jgi:hypothetical protein
MVKKRDVYFLWSKRSLKKISTEALSHGTSYVPVTVSHTFTPGVENISNHQGNVLALNWLRHVLKMYCACRGAYWYRHVSTEGVWVHGLCHKGSPMYGLFFISLATSKQMPPFLILNAKTVFCNLKRIIPFNGPKTSTIVYEVEVIQIISFVSLPVLRKLLFVLHSRE